MVRERQMSGQELVWEATRLLDLPETRDYEVIALRSQIWGPEVRAEVRTQDGRCLSVKVSEFETVDEVAVKIRRLINDVVGDYEPGRGIQPSSPFFVLPDSLEDFRGPTTGTVELPNRLLWNSSRPFDLSDEVRLRSMFRVVLREARAQDDLSTYVDKDSLLRLWPDLGLPDQIRMAWEDRFPELRDQRSS